MTSSATVGTSTATTPATPSAENVNDSWDDQSSCSPPSESAATSDDVAVAVNDWCVDEDWKPAHSHWRALLAAYAARRAFTDQEREIWEAELRASALRFWLSRLYDRAFPRGGDLTLIKDPNPQRQRLEHWRDGSALPLP